MRKGYLVHSRCDDEEIEYTMFLGWIRDINILLLIRKMLKVIVFICF